MKKVILPIICAVVVCLVFFKLNPDIEVVGIGLGAGLGLGIGLGLNSLFFKDEIVETDPEI